MPKKSARVYTLDEIKLDEAHGQIEEAIRDGGDYAEKLRRLTPIQRNFLAQMLAYGGEKTQSQMLKDAGYASGSLPKETKQKIGGKLGKILFEMGIAEDDIAIGIKEGLKAMTSHVITDKDGNVKIVETPDHRTRHQFIKLLAQFGNYFPATKVSGKITHEHGLTEKAQMSLEKMRERELNLSTNPRFIATEYEVSDDPDNGNHAREN